MNGTVATKLAPISVVNEIVLGINAQIAGLEHELSTAVRQKRFDSVCTTLLDFKHQSYFFRNQTKILHKEL